MRIKDPWKIVRQETCFGSVEPNIKLVAITRPTFVTEFTEQIPALSASVSYGSNIRSFEQSIKLNRNLIKMGHLTPLEAIQFNFHVSGISKICGAQMSRHRIGQGHIGGSRRFRKQEMSFVYPLFDYIETEDEVRAIYGVMSAGVQDAFERAEQLKQAVIGVKKSDARYLIPASTATERNWWINARALRDFFRLRLAPDAEWEIRRLAFMLLDIVSTETPSLFQDIAEDFKEAL
jgi:thymidylate synthase (FAD)